MLEKTTNLMILYRSSRQYQSDWCRRRRWWYAVNRMIASDVAGIEFWSITDPRCPSICPLQIGQKLTRVWGRSNPAIGESS